MGGDDPCGKSTPEADTGDVHRSARILMNDTEWLLDISPLATEDEIESFTERVAIMVADDINEHRARQLAYAILMMGVNHARS